MWAERSINNVAKEHLCERTLNDLQLKCHISKSHWPIPKDVSSSYIKAFLIYFFNIGPHKLRGTWILIFSRFSISNSLILSNTKQNVFVNFLERGHSEERSSEERSSKEGRFGQKWANFKVFLFKNGPAQIQAVQQVA